MVDRIKRAKQKSKESSIIRNANRLRTAPKKIQGSGRIKEHQARIIEINSRKGEKVAS